MLGTAVGVAGMGFIWSILLAQDMESFIPSITVGLVDSVERFAREGLASFARELAARDALLGRRVRVGDTEGAAMGIDGEGRLLVSTDAGVFTPIASGHVELVG